LSAGLIDVQLRMLELLHHDLDIDKIGLGNVTVKIRRQLPDTAFNFQYIVDAFSGPPSTQPATTSGSAMRMSLKEVVMDKIRFVYRDTVTGSDMEVWVDHSLAKISRMDLDHLSFGIPTFVAEGVRGRVRQGQPLGGSGAGAAGGTSGASQSMDIGLSLGRLVANVQRLDVNKQIIQVKDFQLDSTSTAVRLGQRPKGAPRPPGGRGGPPGGAARRPEGLGRRRGPLRLRRRIWLLLRPTRRAGGFLRARCGSMATIFNSMTTTSRGKRMVWITHTWRYAN